MYEPRSLADVALALQYLLPALGYLLLVDPLERQRQPRHLVRLEEAVYVQVYELVALVLQYEREHRVELLLHLLDRGFDALLRAGEHEDVAVEEADECALVLVL